MIKRTTVLDQLIQWKNSKTRKPLILQGARQVGKTWLLKHFGDTSFETTAYFNFDEQPELKQFFETTKDTGRIIQNLSLVIGKAILPGKTLIIFDEIQECNHALNALKYFCEEAPQYYIACAGSLLGVSLSRGASFPVGKVDFLQIYPITFSEFLSESDPGLFNYINNIEIIEPIPDIFFNQIIEKYKAYYISGGMPEAMVALLETGDIEQVQQILINIINAFTLDFSKHAENRDVQKIGFIWNSLPSQLAKENKKFFYQAVKQGARAREYENALLWLINSGLAYRIYRCNKPALPLSAYDDLSSFKVYMLDVGLLRRLSRLAPGAIAEGDRLFTEFKGALAENFVLQSLVQQFEGMPRYWTSESKAEVDFLLQIENQIIPVEVKSNANIISKSLTYYRKEFSPELAIRFSLKNLQLNEGLLNIPLFLADYTRKIIKFMRSSRSPAAHTLPPS